MTNSLLTLEGLEEERHLLEIDKCRADPVYFISNYLWIEEPRPEFGGPKWVKFKLWPRQERIVRELVEAYYKQEYRVMFKSRGVGGTYVVLAVMAWLWRFTSDFIGLIGSRKEEEVDKAKGLKKNTLFAKLDGFISHMPEWMQPEGFDRNLHRQHMLLFNPENQASIMGESANPAFGHSNRASMILIDEYARWKDAVFDSALSVCKFIVAISTLDKNVDHFTDLIDRAELLGRLIKFSYEDNPLFDDEWFADMRESMGEITFNREVLMDRTASTAGRVYATFSRKKHVGDYPYNPELPLATIWDFGYSDETYIGFIQKDFQTDELFLVREVVASEQEIEWFVNFYPRARVYPNPYMYPEGLQALQDEIQTWKKPVIDFGDPSGKQRTQLRQGSLFSVLRQYNIRPRCNTVLWNDMGSRVSAARKAMERLHVDKSCEWFIRSAEGYRYPERDPYSSSTADNTKPVHNWASHAMTAFESLCISERMWKEDSEYLDLTNLMKENKYMVIR
jgi:hypothetical protein